MNLKKKANTVTEFEKSETQDMMWSVDTNLNILTANRSFLEIMKILTGKVIKEGDYALIEEFGAEQLSKWELYYQRALKGEQFTVKDQHYNPVKQSMEYGLISLSPMLNDKNVVFCVACYSKDITAETLNLLALEAAKAKLEKILDSSLDMICSIDEKGLILSVSAASETILGYKPDELIGHTLFDYIYPDDLEKTKQMADKVMSGHEMTNYENRYVRKDGALIPLIWSARWDPEGKIRYAIARDATERKENEDALIESEKKYKYLFENSPLPIWVWDFETLQIIDCNEEALAKYGYTREEFLQLSIKDIRPSEEVPLLEKLVKTEESYGKIHKGVWKHKKKNGEIMYMDVSGHLMHYNGKKVTLILADDITESRYYHELDVLEKNILETSARNDKSLSEMIGNYLSEIETLHPGMLCSIQENRGNKLFNLAAPSLPKDYLEAVDGIDIGNNQGSCGTAAFLKQKIIVTDILNDIRWEDFKDIADQYHLKTCWSYPILDSGNNVAATFAGYYLKIKSPSEREENTLKRAGHILQVILESYHREHSLKISNERFEYVTEATSDVIWDWNLETNAVYYSNNINKLFGHTPGINYDNLPFYFEHVHPDDRERVVLYTDQVRYGTMINWTQEYRFRKADGDYAFVLDKGIVIRDENGLGVRMIGVMQDITKLKQNELHIMKQNERLNEIAMINAHEIRRPLANILGLTQLFDIETIGGTSNKEILEYLQTAAQDLDTVIVSIIDKAVD
ncbi:MAG: hypothetical protein JWP44_72 [Mucilaginibacter sp.]|nr:hypothetical protein [Mucilaginibacter sp.]